MNSTDLQYLLITAAKNEDVFIGRTLQSVVSQTVRPMRWLVVSDGSTDRTDEIVSRYAQEHDWIELIEMPVRCPMIKELRESESKMKQARPIQVTNNHLPVLAFSLRGFN